VVRGHISQCRIVQGWVDRRGHQVKIDGDSLNTCIAGSVQLDSSESINTTHKGAATL